MPHELRQTPFFVSDDRSKLDFAVIHRFLSGCYWSKGIPRELVEKAAANSIPFGVYEFSGNSIAQVGFARVVTDRATFAYLADVFVLESHRGRGLSMLLMRCIQSHPDLQGLRRWLLMTRDAHGLYAKCGFAPLASPGFAMEISRRDLYLANDTQTPHQVLPPSPPP
ncbi:MAG: GNAT family N-acetyltransferase [Phycisphaerales bacterium]